MKMKHKSFAIHDFKMVDEESRTVEGWASTFGGVDSYGDTIAPGAFADSIKARKPKMLWQHDSRQVIGVWESATETTQGLYVKGRILDTTLGDDAYKLAKAGAIDSMSIGYGVKDSTYDQKTGIRTLKKIDLWEVSLVTFPANSDATITHVKAALEEIDAAADLLDQACGMCDAYAGGDMEPTAEAFATVSQIVRQAQSLLEEPDSGDEDEGKSRDFTPKNIERILREAGMSRSDARGVLAKGFNAIATPREAGQQEHDRFVKFINSLKS